MGLVVRGLVEFMPQSGEGFALRACGQEWQSLVITSPGREAKCRNPSYCSYIGAGALINSLETSSGTRRRSC